MSLRCATCWLGILIYCKMATIMALSDGWLIPPSHHIITISSLWWEHLKSTLFIDLLLFNQFSSLLYVSQHLGPSVALTRCSLMFWGMNKVWTSLLIYILNWRFKLVSSCVDIVDIFSLPLWIILKDECLKKPELSAHLSGRSHTDDHSISCAGGPSLCRLCL